MKQFSENEQALLNHIGLGKGYIISEDHTICSLERGTLRMTLSKNDNGDVEVFCADEDYTGQVKCIAQTLEDAIRQAFNKYREYGSTVRQTLQFINNAEDSMKQYLEQAK